jgi:hypothetical protein
MPALRLRDAKHTLGLRVQGALIADRETLGFLDIADHVLPVRDWHRFATASGAGFPGPYASTHRDVYSRRTTQRREPRRHCRARRRGSDATRRHAQSHLTGSLPYCHSPTGA